MSTPEPVFDFKEIGKETETAIETTLNIENLIHSESVIGAVVAAVLNTFYDVYINGNASAMPFFIGNTTTDLAVSVLSGLSQSIVTSSSNLQSKIISSGVGSFIWRLIWDSLTVLSSNNAINFKDLLIVSATTSVGFMLGTYVFINFLVKPSAVKK